MDSEDVALPVADLENELTDLINKHGLNPTHTPTRILARYLIRQLDNYRETEREAQDDNLRIQRAMGSESPQDQ